MKISAVVITFNEENNIKRCITSILEVADEIIVVDSFSTDKTEEICTSLPVKFMKHEFEGHIQQKNYAVSQASNDFILSLDADEVLSDQLKQSVNTVKTNPRAEAYCMNRLTNYCGSWIHHCGWYPDRKIRLWDRRKGSWKGENPHDRVIMNEGTTALYIPGDILHYSYNNFSEHLRQVEKFSTIAAQESFNRGKKVSVLIHLIVYPGIRFMHLYFFRLGFLDGMAGFIVCATDAFYRFSKYTKLWMLYRQRK